MIGSGTRLFGVVLLVALLASPVSALAEEERSRAAEAVIERLDGALLEIMRKAKRLGYQGRYEFVAPVVRETFDLVFMASKTLGRHWKSLSDVDRKRWIETFEHFTISNFADRFDGYSGESFEIVGQKPASRETLVVMTKLIRPEADDVTLNYRMREVEDGWRVVDIYSGGKVSEVALRRSEYAVVLERGGIEELIDSVSSKAERRSTE